MKKSHFIYKVLTTLLLLFFSLTDFAMDSYNKLWSSAVITGPLTADSNFRYYMQQDLRLIANANLFNQLLLLGGLGYQLSPTLVFFAGPGWIVDTSPSGVTQHEERLWTQLNWTMVNTPQYTLNSRTRYEANRNTNQPQIAYRWRERVWLRVPFKNWVGHSLSCYDEVFLNVNHPSWVSPYTFAQNRAFIGIGTQLTKSTILDIGYLNQYIHSNTNQLNNVLVLSFTIMN